MGLKRKTIKALMLALCLLVVTSPAYTQTPEISRTIGEVEKDVAGIRGLVFKEAVETRFLTQEELEQKLIEDLNEDYTPEEWERDEAILKLLGFIEEGQDYYQMMLEIYTEQIAGFYSPTDKYLALIAGEEKMTAYERLILSHELTHALQDQYYHLDQPPYHNPDSTDYDADLAAISFV